MHEPVEWNRLDAAGYRVTVKRSVRRVAWFLLVIGIVILACGVMAPLYPLLVIGALYVCVGSWNLWRPSVHGLLLDAIALFAAGIFTALSWKLVEHGDT